MGWGGVGGGGQGGMGVGMRTGVGARGGRGRGGPAPQETPLGQLWLSRYGLPEPVIPVILVSGNA